MRTLASLLHMPALNCPGNDVPPNQWRRAQTSEYHKTFDFYHLHVDTNYVGQMVEKVTYTTNSFDTPLFIKQKTNVQSTLAHILQYKIQ